MCQPYLKFPDLLPEKDLFLFGLGIIFILSCYEDTSQPKKMCSRWAHCPHMLKLKSILTGTKIKKIVSNKQTNKQYKNAKDISVMIFLHAALVNAFIWRIVLLYLTNVCFISVFTTCDANPV